MKNSALILIAGVVSGVAFYYIENSNKSINNNESYLVVIDAALNEIKEAAQDVASDLTGGFIMKISNMKFVTYSDVQHPNVQAFLKVIRRGEGTSDPDGYRRHFGGDLFTSYADHPRKVITKNYKSGTYHSSAAGAYQFLKNTWDETRRIMGLTDFSPANQDLGAVGRLAARGALDDVKAGRFELAIKKTAKEWASLPFSPYGQPTISLATAANVYQSNGGVIA